MVATRLGGPAGGSFAERTIASAPSTHVVAPPRPPLLTAQPSTRLPVEERALTASQVEAIRVAMKLFVEDDLSQGVVGSSRIYCDGCERPRPAAGFINYDRYVLCNNCAIEYEVARARGAITTPGQYVRDKHFGDGDLHALVE